MRVSGERNSWLTSRSNCSRERTISLRPVDMALKERPRSPNSSREAYLHLVAQFAAADAFDGGRKALQGREQPADGKKGDQDQHDETRQDEQ